MEVEQVQCGCGGTKTTVLATKGILHKGEMPRDCTTVICETCGLVFMNPRPSKEEYNRLYAQYGEERHSLDSETAVLNYIKGKEIGLKKKASSIINFLKPHIPSAGTVLDIGTGIGTMSVAMRDQLHWEVEGIEPGVSLAKIISKQFGLNIFNGTLDDFLKNYPEKKFDLLILHHVFEHFTEPVKRLRELLNMLNSGGLIYMEIPNVTDFKKPVHQFFDLLHPYSYSPTTLQNIVEASGAKIIAWNKEKPYR